MKRYLDFWCRKPWSLLSAACLGWAIMGAVCWAENLPEPGPENCGMRLRFVVVPKEHATNESYDVRLDLISVTNQPITLRGDWEHDQTGDYKEYLESDVSIESFPEIIGWMGQAAAGHRKLPQPEYVLEPGKTLTVTWTATGRHLKNKVAHYLSTKNPNFVAEGLYSVHATIPLCVAGVTPVTAPAKQPTFHRSSDGTTNRDRGDEFWFDMHQGDPHGTVLLRSNEQLVPIGGSRRSPKYPLGRVVNADTNTDVVTIDLGSMQQIEAGDRFWIWSGYTAYIWELKITNVSLSTSSGHFELANWHANTNFNPRAILPRPGFTAELLPARTVR